MAGLSLSNITKSYGNVQVIHGVDLEIEDGEFVVFVGPSGCGKSTLLRSIAGLEEISGGTFKIGDRVVNEVSPSKRGVAMVFQTYALYPHMTVFKNMAFGLKQAKTPAPEIERRVKEAAEVLQITDYLDRTPKNLSGGQRQRVAIGRAIVRDPEVFLFDEPLSNLDAALRVQTRLEIARLHARLKSTMIYVTHDQVEAMTLADKIVVLRDGRIEQVGSPLDLYHRPQNLFVAGFIGSPTMNFFDASLVKGHEKGDEKGDAATVGIRPEHLHQCSANEALVTAEFDLMENLGEHVLVHLKVSNNGQHPESIIAKFEHAPTFKTGDTVYLKCDADRIYKFDKDGNSN